VNSLCVGSVSVGSLIIYFVYLVLEVVDQFGEACEIYTAVNHE